MEKKFLIDQSGQTNTLSRFKSHFQGPITVLLLCAINLINNSDRYILSSMLIDIEKFFQVSKSTAGLLQTVYLAFFMLITPLTGYLGDRFSRKFLLIVGIIVWISSTVLGSLCERQQFALFVVSRCLFGLASGIFGPVCVPIIGDRFANNEQARGRALVVFSVGPPLGIGVAYMISLVSKQLISPDWRYSMRFSPFLLLFVLVAIFFLYEEPERRGTQVKSDVSKINKRGFIMNIKILARNKTYVLLVFSWAFGLSSYVGFNWWSPSLIEYSLGIKNLTPSEIDSWKSLHSVLQPVSGVVGIIVPNEVSLRLKKRGVSNADCFIFAFGFAVSSLLLFFYLNVVDLNPYLGVAVLTATIMTFNICWVIQSKVFLDIVHPSLRSTANSLITFSLHLVGDDISPYWTGLIADVCLAQFSIRKNTIAILLYCTKVSLYPLVVLSFLAAFLAVLMSLMFKKDHEMSLNDHEF